MHTFITEKINDIKITPLITHTSDPNEVLGGKMFIDPFSNTLICSKKKSGKTTLLYHILKKITRGGYFKTNVVIFCSTYHKDQTYKKIIDMLESKGCNVIKYTHFKDGKENIVENLLNELKEHSDDEDDQETTDEESSDDIEVCKFENNQNDIRAKKPRKPKKISAEWVLVFDDMGSEMRNKAINQLSKVLRHYKARTFFLQQYLFDLDAQARKQLDYVILFKSFNEEKLKNIYESLDLSVDFQTFIDLYHFATDKPY
jgi:predicted transcriptional regulator